MIIKSNTNYTYLENRISINLRKEEIGVKPEAETVKSDENCGDREAAADVVRDGCGTLKDRCGCVQKQLRIAKP
jgi:hypothetical protein